MSPLTCQEFIEFIDDYLDGGLDADKHAVFASHLAECDECQCYLKTYQESVAVFRAICAENTKELPPNEVPAELVNGILAALEKKS